MQIAPSIRIIGVLLMCFSISYLPPLLVSLWDQDGAYSVFLVSTALTLFTGFLFWLGTVDAKRELRTRDGFLVVVLAWTVVSLLGSLPFIIADNPSLSVVDAFFETAAGLTTTGATVISGLDSLPRSILYYRQQLQFLGGMGIVVLAVAILPMLGIGGQQLFRAESSGMIKDNKLTPRITETAKALWLIYVGLNVFCALAFWLFGMELFDAIGYAFATVSTGGYAPHDASFAYYPSAILQTIAIVFMILGGLNFSLHFTVLRYRRPLAYLRDTETLGFLAIQVAIIGVTCAVLLLHKVYTDPATTLLDATFQTISLSTTTGFTSTDFTQWPLFIPILLMLGGTIGACAGSTTGGLKTIRLLLLFKQVWCETKRLVHPTGIFLLKMNRKSIPEHVMSSVWAFIGVYVTLCTLLIFALMACDLNFIEAFSAVVSCVANIGPGLGRLASNYGILSDVAKWILAAAMIIGKLEIFGVLVLLSPTFWRD